MVRVQARRLPLRVRETRTQDPGLSLPQQPPSDALPASWQQQVASFRTSDTARSLFQFVSTWAAFFVLWTAALLLLDVHWLLTLVTDAALGGVCVRLFIIQHDCGHGSFFATERANAIAGFFPSVLMLTPYGPWRRDHAIHHATTGNLEKRGVGDIETWTVNEYRAATPLQRLRYRAVRHPLIMLGFGPLGVFMLGHRFPAFFSKSPTASDRLAVHVTTIVGLSIWAGIIAIFGWKAFLLVHLPASWMAGAAGIFLFYVQHQYDEPYWRRPDDWSYREACLQGCSHLKLGRVLGWFSGDIGVHHLHHLAPRIPNYKLRPCLESNPDLGAVHSLSLWQAIKTLGLKLYDEDSGRMVGFSGVIAR
jgi:omega-6 fatty acid desaturase (delta-12 desaturase)